MSVLYTHSVLIFNNTINHNYNMYYLIYILSQSNTSLGYRYIIYVKFVKGLINFWIAHAPLYILNSRLRNNQLIAY